MTENSDNKGIKIFSLSSNRPLAEKIAKTCGVELGKATINKFSDGEIKIQIDESIRGDSVYIIQSMSDPINANVMELFIMIDAVRRTSAKSINVVIPYYGYARYTAKKRERKPIVAKLIASVLENDGIDRVVTLDLHSPQIQGFFNKPVDNLKMDKIMSNHMKKNYDLDNAVVVSPDHAGVARARGFAGLIDSPIAIVDDRDPGNVKHIPTFVIGDVKDKVAIIADDMIDTGNGAIKAANVLAKHGAAKIYVVSTHGVFAKDALERIEQSPIEKVIVSDSIYLDDSKKTNKLDIVSVADLIGNAITRIHENKSVGKLFK
ncbi:ribose-phosphate pyrophosphokinase [Apilactobacillus micheneri]|uniref:ribose-phosphate diphosphokinase n=1 Tax=Apilactobacillus micheneri TaxID=1899430 RepID=A0ABY2Z1Y9_9LACO|nr:ribose-phosphate pyrophosphokinase [Apilactobacillus micheneri]TPR25724.1 ribose-phosphate pyrophosphokinase [Apilactobacillus micheneri]TPR26828.1 ribose-phosphate pyrophosphokinase [Apilactobacillus micheneri]TPR28616.1 ribose-phosphate pyrophosphokinase [Apilactobacillus micheneri]TPR29303.1 ribose-phosphate pyrophosphokinase [Apilactobacillus micheneri]TPR30891.1 ribose-phosphate pyrophosphokinase [Apilactobacillus micheneri]